MSTIHNPSNFQPEDYTILDYLDNQRPEYVFGMHPDQYHAEVAAWRSDWQQYFQQPQHRCFHCGNGNVRYCVIARHIPSGDLVVFGVTCVERLRFADHDEFKADQVRKAAAAARFRHKVAAKATQFIDARPALKKVVEQILNDEAQQDNGFAQDVVSKLFQYGDLSDRQIECLLESPQKHLDWKKRDAERKELEKNIPEWKSGVLRVTGEVVKRKTVDGYYGRVRKALIVLEDGRKCWGTSSTRFPVDLQVKFSFTAEFEVSKDDPKFAYYKRPKQIEILEQVESK